MKAMLSQPMADFNPRSHGGSDGIDCAEPWAEDISIHAPTGGATRNWTDWLGN